MPKRFKAGDPLHISAVAWNTVLDYIGFDVDANSSWVKGALPVSWLFVRNTHVTPRIKRGAPVCVLKPSDLTGVTAVEYQENPQEFIHTSVASSFGELHHQHFGIAMEPIELNAVGRVAVAGVVWANIKTTVGDFEDYADTARYVHLLPDSDGDYLDKVMLNTSGFAEVFGDHVRLNVRQPIFRYSISDVDIISGVVSLKADISGLPTAVSGGTTFWVAEDVPLHVVEGPLVSTGFAIGDVGLCVPYNNIFLAITQQHTDAIIGLTNATGTARSGTTVGSGTAVPHRIVGSTLTPVRNAAGTDVTITYKNTVARTIGDAKWIQLKRVGANHVIDLEECGPTTQPTVPEIIPYSLAGTSINVAIGVGAPPPP